MTDHLTLTKQTKILGEWQEEIERCLERLLAAAANAGRAVGHRQEYAGISSPEDITATQMAMGQFLASKEAGSLQAIATLCKVFAAATGQTNEQLVDKLVTVINQ